MTIGIIAEYNPFHKGHLYHLQKTREKFPNKPIVVAMSGDFVERGELAIAPAHLRAKWALDSGANLVLEIPSPFVLQNANVFARESIRLLSTFSITHLSFGSVQPLQELLRMHDEEVTYKEALEEIISRERKSGASLPKAYATARKEVLDSMMRFDPNDLLALVYLRYLPSTIKPYAVTRIGATHDMLEEGAFPSALHIRKLLRSGKSPELPECVTKDLAKLLLFSENRIVPLLKYSLLFGKDDSTILHYENGLADRLRKTESRDFNNWIANASSKRYTHSRIRRYILSRLSALRAFQDDAIYTRVLAMDNKGRTLLRNTTARLLTHGKKISHYRTSPTVQAMLRISFLADLLLDRTTGSIYTAKPTLK